MRSNGSSDAAISRRGLIGLNIGGKLTDYVVPCRAQVSEPPARTQVPGDRHATNVTGLTERVVSRSDPSPAADWLDATGHNRYDPPVTIAVKAASAGNSHPESAVLNIPSQVLQSAIRSVGEYFEPLNRVNREVLGRDHVNPLRYLRNIEALDREIPLAGKKLLEIGSGFGVSLAIMLKRFGVDAYGIEPASEGFDASNGCAREILRANDLDPARVIDAVGESIPFPDGSFDIVYSNNVLEHTSEPAKVLSEAARVLKPGGTLFVEVPNYLSYYEGHYLVPQPPILWNGLLAFWVQTIFRRDPSFARTLHTEINPIWLRRTLRLIDRRYPLEVRTLGEERFLQRISRPFAFQTDALAGIAGRAIHTLQALNWHNWLGRLLVRLQAHYPIVLVATRRGSDS
jgi:SAM-dependent methyltransferase